MPEQMVYVRKAAPGGDSFGHQWPDAGSVVEMPADQAAVLVAIHGGGFSIVDKPTSKPSKPADPPADPPDDPAKTQGDPAEPTDDDQANDDVTEPAPAAKVTEPAPRSTSRAGRAGKSTAKTAGK